MNGDCLLPLLGLPHTDRDVQATLRSLKIMRDPEVGYADEDDEETLQTQDFLGNLNLGIEFGFEDTASFKGLHPDEIGNGPMLLTHIYFFLDNPNSNPFTGDLPFGLSASDSDKTVRHRMANAEPSLSLRSYTRDVWESPRLRVIASYSEARKLAFLVVMQPPKPTTVDPEDAERLPSVGRILSLLGTEFDDRELAMSLRSLQFGEVLDEIGDRVVASLEAQYGLRLEFAPDSSTLDVVLDRATFSREDAANNPRWPLDLPHRIEFDMSPADIFAVLGPPESQVEDDFTGCANWLFPLHELRVNYSMMDNYVLNVDVQRLPAADKGDDDA